MNNLLTTLLDWPFKLLDRMGVQKWYVFIPAMGLLSPAYGLTVLVLLPFLIWEMLRLWRAGRD